MEAQKEEEEHLEVDHEEIQVGGDRVQVVEVCIDQVVANGQRGQEAGAGRGVQGEVEALGPWGQASP